MKKISYYLIILSIIGTGLTASGLSPLGEEVSSPGYAIPDIEAADGEVYVAYKDFDNYPPGQDYVLVRTFDGTGWVNVGTPRLIPGISALSLKKADKLYLAYIDVNGSLLIQQKAASGDWSYFATAAGSPPLPIARAEHLCHLSASLDSGGALKMAVAFKDEVTKRGGVSVYNNTTGSWGLLGGAPVTVTAINDIQLAYYNDRYYAAFTEKDSNISRLRVQQYNPGTGWMDVCPQTPYLSPTTNHFQFTADESGKLWLAVYDSCEYKVAFSLDTTLTSPEWLSLCFSSGTQVVTPASYCKSNLEGHKFFKGEPDGDGNFYAIGQTNNKIIFMYEWNGVLQTWRQISPAVTPSGYRYIATNTSFAVDRSTNIRYAAYQAKSTNALIIMQDP